MSKRRPMINIANLTDCVKCCSDQADVVRRADEGLNVRARVHVLAATVLVRVRVHPTLGARRAACVHEHCHAVAARPTIDLIQILSARSRA